MKKLNAASRLSGLPPMSWIAVVQAEPGHLLFGGGLEWKSSRLESYRDAVELSEVVAETNQKGGRMCRPSVVASRLGPEIMHAEVAGEGKPAGTCWYCGMTDKRHDWRCIVHRQKRQRRYEAMRRRQAAEQQPSSGDPGGDPSTPAGAEG